jgi:GNAT superfamily N-acetyltransferase
MKIRDYSDGDKDEIKEMVSEILVDIFNGDPAKFKIIKEFRNKKDYVKYLVAEIDGKITGIMALKKENKSAVRLKRMYVRKGYEHRGIAQKLLDELLDFAKINGYKKVLLHTYPIMKGANNFHKKNGFVETTGKDPEMIHVVKHLQ